MSVMSGFLLGSLPAVWPWRKVSQTYYDEYGELISSHLLPVFPWEYSVNQELNPQLELCVFMMLLGFSIICILELFASKNGADS